jgi:hypothetical protein
MNEPLTIFTIYNRPKDYPEHFVVRRWTVQDGKERPHECRLAENLAEARKLVPPHAARLERMVQDDPCIVENWI